MRNNRGSASVKTVIASALLVLLMYSMAQITALFVTSGHTMISAQAKVWERLNGINTPCLEDFANGDFEGGGYTAVSGSVDVGLGAMKRSYQITKRVTFLTLTGEICR